MNEIHEWPAKGMDAIPTFIVVAQARFYQRGRKI
jgi:hypothetical protein